MSRLLLAAVALVPVLVTGGKAHEFWIEPKKYQITPGETLSADLKNGEMFAGAAQPWYDPRNARVERRNGGETHPITGRPGDLPALRVTPEAQGLIALVHQSTPTRLTYKDWDTVLSFAAHKDFPWFEERHAARGLPQEGVRESYTRYNKSLVAVGAGDGGDAPTRLEVEFVALANPYRDDLSGGLPVRLLYKGEPRPDAQVEVYAKDDAGTVERGVLRTGPDGVVKVPVRPGLSYLLDHVVLREPGADAAEGAMWESLWASLTFAVPGAE
ncbi:DUF4198 domain-containing protein [Pseudooceanicola sp.]|uniref:DUF4198 domain-containing protein n=1 Tax=Pseudooceanicola sp. TaxID=1914328 RepID=UPI00405A04BD